MMNYMQDRVYDQLSQLRRFHEPWGDVVMRMTIAESILEGLAEMKRNPVMGFRLNIESLIAVIVTTAR